MRGSSIINFIQSIRSFDKGLEGSTLDLNLLSFSSGYINEKLRNFELNKNQKGVNINFFFFEGHFYFLRENKFNILENF
jgi:hypothetical protein